MSVVYFDGFNSYGSASIGDRWTVSGGWSIAPVDGRHGSACLVASPAAGSTASRDLGGAVAHAIVGFGFQWNGTFDSGDYFRICRFMSGATPAASFGYSFDDGLVIKNASGAAVATLAASFLPSTWYYVELDLPLSGAPALAGGISMRVGGSTVASNGSSASLGAPFSATAFEFGSDSGDAPVNIKYDDLYILNVNVSPHTAMLGVCRCETIRPSGIGSNTGFTSSAGSNFSCVDDANADGDTTYVSSNASYSVGDAAIRDTYSMGDLANTPALVHSLQVVSVGRVESGGVKTLSNAIRVGGTNYDSSNSLSLTTDYKILLSQWELNPSGVVPWTGTAVNSAEAGFIDTP